jgi:FAD/FMN-containing dehydrogenase
VDNLLEVELVTADGSLITASKTTNSELFWGIRGAGFNFGIVLSATYRIYDLRNGGNVTNADFVFPFEKGSELLRVIKRWEDHQPEALAIAMASMWNPKTDEVRFPPFYKSYDMLTDYSLATL